MNKLKNFAQGKQIKALTGKQQTTITGRGRSFNPLSVDAICAYETDCKGY